MTYTIQVSHDVTDEFLSDILITAFDGAYGACWYWCDPSRDDSGKWLYTDNDLWETVAIREHDSGNVYFVNLGVVAIGLRRILSGRVGVNNDLRGHIFSAVEENDAGEIDALCADVIIQAALFDGLVYG